MYIYGTISNYASRMHQLGANSGAATSFVTEGNSYLGFTTKQTSGKWEKELRLNQFRVTRNASKLTEQQLSSTPPYVPNPPNMAPDIQSFIFTSFTYGVPNVQYYFEINWLNPVGSNLSWEVYYYLDVNNGGYELYDSTSSEDLSINGNFLWPENQHSVPVKCKIIYHNQDGFGMESVELNTTFEY